MRPAESARFAGLVCKRCKDNPLLEAHEIYHGVCRPCAKTMYAVYAPVVTKVLKTGLVVPR